MTCLVKISVSLVMIVQTGTLPHGLAKRLPERVRYAVHHPLCRSGSGVFSHCVLRMVVE